MKTQSFLTSLILLAAGALSVSASGSATVLTISDSLHTMPIVYPESFEIDAVKMQENWYLKNYAAIDSAADTRASVEVTDAEIIDRLSKLPTTIEMPFNSVVRNYIDMYANKRKQLVENMLGLGTYYMPIFIDALERHNMPIELKYLPVIESALNPNAVSRVGATGLWQFMPATAKGEGLEINSLVDQRRDPYASSDAAVRYLKKLYNTYKDWSLAIAAYNCGPGNVNKAIRRAGGVEGKDFWAIYPFLPTETRGYVPAFIAANYIMTYYGEHNIAPALARKPIVVDSVHVTRRVHFQQISEVMNIPMEELRVLNPQYRADLIPGNIKPYSLVLPSLQAYAYVTYEDSIVKHDSILYARLTTSEPGVSQSIGTDDRGRYVLTTRTIVHVVKRGETLKKIANKYGVTQSSIRQNNGIGKKVKRGQRLNIIITEREYIDENPIDETPVDSTATSTATTTAATDPTTTVQPAQEREPVVQQTPTNRETIYRVRRGDSLSKIAQKFGVTVKAIKKANNLQSDRINVGQRLKIPTR